MRASKVGKVGQSLPDQVNEAGAPAFSMKWDERLVQFLTTSVYENTYYVKAEELLSQGDALFQEACKKDPEFFAKALVYARNEGLMRSAPIQGLVHLSSVANKKGEKELFAKTFPKIIKNLGDLLEFAENVRCGSTRGMGYAVKKAINKWLKENLTEYGVIKYASSSQKFSLRDLVRLTRPVGRKFSPLGQALLLYITDREKFERSTEAKTAAPQVSTYLDFLKEKKLEKAKEGKLPYEVVTAQISTPEAWQHILDVAPFMNMLRNLRNFAKNSLFENKENVAKIVNRLTDESQVARSKQFPFRFYSALAVWEELFGVDNPKWDRYPWGGRNYSRSETLKKGKFFEEVQEALLEALELSLCNFPDLPGKTYIGSDVSGSMSSYVSDKSRVTYLEICALFSAALVKKSDDVHVATFSNDCQQVNGLRRKDSLASIMEKVRDNQEHGGTDMSSSIQHIIKGNVDVDNVILITDNESWMDINGWGRSTRTTELIKKYRSQVNSKTKFFLIRIDPYPTTQVPPHVPGVYHISGWSDQVLKMISSTISGVGKQIEAVKAIEL
jgi:60 kDa SS-A/Ro ribonucleoprotein